MARLKEYIPYLKVLAEYINLQNLDFESKDYINTFKQFKHCLYSQGSMRATFQVDNITIIAAVVDIKVDPNEMHDADHAAHRVVLRNRDVFISQCNIGLYEDFRVIDTDDKSYSNLPVLDSSSEDDILFQYSTVYSQDVPDALELDLAIRNYINYFWYFHIDLNNLPELSVMKKIAKEVRTSIDNSYRK